MFVDNKNFFSPYEIIYVLPVDRVRLKGIFNMVDIVVSLGCVNIFYSENLLDFHDSALGERGGFLLLINLIMIYFFQSLRNLSELHVLGSWLSVGS